MKERRHVNCQAKVCSYSLRWQPDLSNDFMESQNGELEIRISSGGRQGRPLRGSVRLVGSSRRKSVLRHESRLLAVLNFEWWCRMSVSGRSTNRVGTILRRHRTESTRVPRVEARLPLTGPVRSEDRLERDPIVIVCCQIRFSALVRFRPRRVVLMDTFGEFWKTVSWRAQVTIER